MPLSLNQIASDEASVTFPYAGESITVVYYPGRITEKMLHTLNQLQSLNDSSGAEQIMGGLGSFNHSLANLIKTWDVYEDAEHTIMIPLTAERFSDLPVPFKTEVFTRIMGNMNPNSEAA